MIPNLRNMWRHNKKVKEIQERLKKAPHKISLSCHTSNTLRDNEYKKITHHLNLSSLNKVLHIDQENRYALVEPSITFAALCKKTLKKNLIPKVVPEFESITVGGAIMGAALESSSHKYGQFCDTCIEYELILGDGTKMIASREKNPELFYGVSGSYGTLALLTLVKVSLIPAKKYVSLTYVPLHSIEELLDFFHKNETNDFLEGMAFSKDRLLGIKGVMSDQKEHSFYSQKRYFSHWFPTHLSQIFSETKETMSIKDYLFRFDRGAFWMGYFMLKRTFFLKALFNVGVKHLKNTKITSLKVPFLFRLFFGWLFPSKRLYKLWHRVPKALKENLFIIQDFYTPAKQVPFFFKYLTENIGIYPLWFCPLLGTQTPQYASPHFGKERFFINIGVYGMPNSSSNTVDLTIQLEKKIISFGGKKMLYSLTYYDEKSFNDIYHGSELSMLREKFHAEKSFLSLYNKVTAR